MMAYDIWCDTIWYVMWCYDMTYTICDDVMQRVVMWCDVMLCDVIRCVVMWRDMILHEICYSEIIIIGGGNFKLYHTRASSCWNCNASRGIAQTYVRVPFSEGRTICDDVMRCVVMWSNVMWCDVMWCGVVWCGVMWCDVGSYDMK